MTLEQTGAGTPTVGIVGLGYIGLPTAAVIARAGLDVLGLEIDQRVVDTINQGDIHIEEAGLAEAVEAAVASGRLRATVRPEPRDVWLIAVPTPFHEDRTPDTSIVFAAARQIAPVLRAGDLVIVESTCPVGTTHAVQSIVAEARPDLLAASPAAVMFAYCPERVLPGKILEELIANDRSIGGIDPASTEAAQRFYGRFVAGECVATDARTAEMVKLVENASRDVSIAFANELSLVADRLGLDVWEIINLANRHPRVSILQPGPGVGGHCIAVDPWFIVAAAPDEARLIRTAREVNDGKPGFVLRKAETLLAARPGARLACLGLAFKPDTDDLRESPALEIAQALATRHGARIVCVEPNVRILPEPLAQTGAELLDWDAAVSSCELALVLVDHADFRGRGRRAPFAAFYDTRGMWDA